MPAERDIRQAIAAADDAFWEVIAAKFPKIKTGDVGRIELREWDKAKEAIVRHWLHNNNPELR
jgi:hypothetical protein